MLVTAIMPTADRAAFAPLAIRCFLAQIPFPGVESELLIVDDGVQPLVPQAAIDDGLVHPRIRYVRLRGPRRSTGEKRNACCELARGDLIIHWDDDDWSARTRLASQVDFLLRSGKQVTGFHDVLYHDSRSGKAYRYVSSTKPYATGHSQCYFRSWWAEHRFSAKQVGEDTDFCDVARAAGQLASTDCGELLVARQHEGNSYHPGMGDKSFPEIGLDLLPTAFRELL